MTYTYKFIGGPLGGVEWKREEFYSKVHTSVEGTQHLYEQVSVNHQDEIVMDYRGKETVLNLAPDLQKIISGSEAAMQIARKVQELYAVCDLLGYPREQADNDFSELSKTTTLTTIQAIDRVREGILAARAEVALNTKYTIINGQLVPIPAPSSN